MNFFKYLTKTSISLAIFLLIGGVALGCGGDDDDDVTPGQGGQSNVGSGGTSNTNATAGTTGAAGSTAGAACVTTTTCGSESCDVSAGSTQLASTFFSMACFKACCTADNKCGAQLAGQGLGAAFLTGGACMEVKQQGNLSTSCPNSISNDDDAGTAPTTGPMTQITNMFNYKGCCRPDAKCGLDLTKLGLGCVANENIKDLASFFGDFVAAKTCTP